MSDNEVVVTDIRIPFGSMVVLILKWTLASIPAMFIVGIVVVVVFGVIGGLLTGLPGGG